MLGLQLMNLEGAYFSAQHTNITFVSVIYLVIQCGFNRFLDAE